jgi:glycosyltransferase involved in cell wall biosynthesis
MLSIIIPSYKDPLLNKTVDNLLLNAKGDIEIICVLDGYWQDTIGDPRVKILHLGKNRGMRGAINAGVSISSGEFIMRADEHQTFGEGYDVILTKDCKSNWIVTPRRFFLDPDKWEVMDIPPIDYMKLIIAKDDDGNPFKFTGQDWKSRTKERGGRMIDETMAMQGSCWVMPRSLWDSVIGELQTEGYGPLIQDSHEMVFKLWKAGGRLMVNKNTWHAHKHRSFSRTHNNGTTENPANCTQGYKYALDVWGDYYKEIKEQWKI